MADEVGVPTELKEESSKEQIGVFDPTKKKKKKKQRSATDDDGEKVAEKLEELTVSEGSEFAGLKKKSKGKKQSEGELDDEEIKQEVEEEGGEEEGEGEDIGSVPLSLKKKKKKKVRAIEEELPVEEEPEEEEGKELEEASDDEAEGIDLTPSLPWEGSDRDYLYEELLDRVFNILRANNPELAGTKRRTIMRPPQVLREGTKKTVFVNFMDLCKTMHRQPEHVMAFLLAELGTSGSLDGQQRLVVKGRFAPKNFEGILRRYVNEYVMCAGCKSPDTILHKENRLFFLRCEQCGSGRSVAPIKAGFVARVGKRKTA